MKTVTVSKFCINYDIPQQFIDSLSKYDLIELVEKDTSRYIQVDDINRIEKLMRLHYELDVNFEGLDIINNLLNRIDELKQDISRLKNRLEFYE